MFYVKTEINDNIEIKVDLYDDEIFTRCPKCGKEIQVETQSLRTILNGGNLASSSLCCKECSKEFLNK